MKLFFRLLQFQEEEKKQYLSSELEKMHPCFSDEFIFDSALKKINRKGLSESVYVMNKYKLAEYEGKRHFSGLGFFIDEKHHGKRFFINKKWKLILSMPVFVLAVVVMCICGASYAVKKTGLKGVKSIKTEDTKLVSEIPERHSTYDSEKESFDVSSFLQTVKNAGGKITLLEFRTEGFTQNITASVSGVYPETLPGEVFRNGGESVLYENGIPKMQISYSWKISDATRTLSASGLVSPYLSNYDFNKMLRDKLIEHGAVLKVEKAPPYHIEFVCKTKDSELFDSLSNLINEDNRIVSYVSVKLMENEKLYIGLSIESVPVKGFDLSWLSQNIPLFIEEKKSESKKIVRSTKIPETLQKKIGEIRRADNSLVIYFKDSDGKIQKRIEETKK